ncbi:hypothetical protein F0562_031992 [Nyssa sinensis]|uniref:HAT C-terminal dimerisation domain-containing protein n=1 Tax=Nyssa sinensis TaxID=561372 RepID=A0A5J5ATN8_9ASTE|nr:hypothetical protein F0562_031992 [Nyssa sinensis]
MAGPMEEKCEKYWYERSLVLAIALVLDPRSSNANSQLDTIEDHRFNEFDNWYTHARSTTIHAYQKSKIEQYLEEPVFPRKEEFNILHWWKVNSAKLPTLVRMARDILALSAATVASEAAFSVGGRIIDESCSCLLPDIVEALVTAND